MMSLLGRYTPGPEFRRASPSASAETVLERHPHAPLPILAPAHHGPVVTSTLGLGMSENKHPGGALPMTDKYHPPIRHSPYHSVPKKYA
jgi:hypothetical protein